MELGLSKEAQPSSEVRGRARSVLFFPFAAITLLLSLSTAASAQTQDLTWLQSGESIVTSYTEQNYYRSVDVSADGSRMVVADPTSGVIRVFDLVDGAWTQVARRTGVWSASLAMSADGLRVAVVGLHPQPLAGNADRARVFEVVASTLRQVGQDLLGDGRFDDSVPSIAISADGERIAVGAPRSDQPSIEPDANLRTYELIDGSWTQVGGKIDADIGALNADGSVLVAGSFVVDGDGKAGLRVFELDGGAWVQLGQGLFRDGSISPAAIDVNADGSRIIIGGPYNDNGVSSTGRVSVYGLVGGSWIQIGADIYGQHIGESFGHTVSISDDGLRIAGAVRRSFDGAGLARIYDLIDGDWIQVGNDVGPKLASGTVGAKEIELTADGSQIVIGRDRYGVTRQALVFQLVEATWCGGQIATIVGTPGNDILAGTEGSDVIAGLQGDDIITGMGGDDVLCGGTGDDTIYGGQGFDIIYGGQGFDIIYSADGDTPRLRNDVRGMRAFGGAGNDIIYGSNRWDRMQGGPGNDQLFGFEGRDWIRGGDDTDTIDGGNGIDDLHGGNGNDTIMLTHGDTVRGGAGAKDTCNITGIPARITSCEIRP